VCRQVIPPTGIRHCRPLRSSGTRAVSVLTVGITHHGWQAGNCKIERARVLRLWRMESTEAILIRKRKFSDTSLIVSWCTDSFGCVQTVAKGARRLKSPFAGKLDLFFEAEISIVRSRKTDLHTLTEVVLKNPFPGIRSNYLRTQTAAYFVELIEICTERDHREPELFALLRRAFGYLDANDPTSRAVAHFETELARIAGVHDMKSLKADPAYALGNLFGRLPLSRTPLLKTLAAEAKESSK
jgi:DNA repair protein RecO (recombination protein O)